MANKILIDALKQIASHGHNGICPYGCDAPYIAIKALVVYGEKGFDVEYFKAQVNMYMLNSCV